MIPGKTYLPRNQASNYTSEQILCITQSLLTYLFHLGTRKTPHAYKVGEPQVMLIIRYYITIATLAYSISDIIKLLFDMHFL